MLKISIPDGEIRISDNASNYIGFLYEAGEVVEQEMAKLEKGLKIWEAFFSSTIAISSDSQLALETVRIYNQKLQEFFADMTQNVAVFRGLYAKLDDAFNIQLWINAVNPADEYLTNTAHEVDKALGEIATLTDHFSNTLSSIGNDAVLVIAPTLSALLFNEFSTRNFKREVAGANYNFRNICKMNVELCATVINKVCREFLPKLNEGHEEAKKTVLRNLISISGPAANKSYWKKIINAPTDIQGYMELFECESRIQGVTEFAKALNINIQDDSVLDAMLDRLKSKMDINKLDSELMMSNICKFFKMSKKSVYLKMYGTEDIDYIETQRALLAEKKEKEAEETAKAEEEKIRCDEERRVKRKKQVKIILLIVMVLAIAAGMFMFVIKPAYDYKLAVAAMESGDYSTAATLFESAGSFKNAGLLAQENHYSVAMQYLDSGELGYVLQNLRKAGDYKDSVQLADDVQTQIHKRIAIIDDNDYADSIFGVKSDGTVAITFYNKLLHNLDVRNWTDIVAVAAGELHVVALKADGTVVAAGSNFDGQCAVNGWTDIVAIAAGDSYTLGLKDDGTVVVAGGRNSPERFKTKAWNNIKEIYAYKNLYAGIRTDGSVVSFEDSRSDKKVNTVLWHDIVKIEIGLDFILGLTADGTVVATGNTADGTCDVQDWSDIVSLSTSGIHTVGLKADGTVVATEYKNKDPYSPDDVLPQQLLSWRDIVAIDAKCGSVYGLKADGTVVYHRSTIDVGYLNNWTDIVAIKSDDVNIVGIKSDGTIVVEANSKKDRYDLSSYDLW